MKKVDYYEQLHKKNLKSFTEISKKIVKGIFKIIDIRIDEPDFGHRRIVIFLHEED